jgi:hypothetical protein
LIGTGYEIERRPHPENPDSSVPNPFVSTLLSLPHACLGQQ